MQSGRVQGVSLLHSMNECFNIWAIAQPDGWQRAVRGGEENICLHNKSGFNWNINPVKNKLILVDKSTIKLFWYHYYLRDFQELCHS